MRKNQTLLCIAILFFGIQPGILANNPETSVAGFFDLEKSGRIIYNFNPGWRYHKEMWITGNLPGWTTPHGGWFLFPIPLN